MMRSRSWLRVAMTAFTRTQWTIVSLLVVGLPCAAQSQVQGSEMGGTWTVSFSAGGNPDAVGGARNPSPPPLKPAFLEAWEALQAEIRAADERGEPLATAATFCLPQGMPAMMGGGGPFPMEIIVTANQVTIIQEAYTQVRRIYLDRPQLPIEDIEPGFYGRSVGHWDGDVLVVDTTGIKESVRYQNVPHSAAMRITERLALQEDGRLRDEITIDDPVYLERPWSFAFEFAILPDYEMMEYVCEDNREYADESGATRLRLQ